MQRTIDQSAQLFRVILLAVGWLFVGVGIVGVFVPVMPSAVFFLVALWLFSKGSKRFHDWLYNHRIFGPVLLAWSRHRVIPPKAKALALICMATSVAIVALFVVDGWQLPLALGLINAIAGVYIVSRPGRVPATAGVQAV
jgi:uncharacterized membrane protein YbaN (DUF454 family)